MPFVACPSACLPISISSRCAPSLTRTPVCPAATSDAWLPQRNTPEALPQVPEHFTGNKFLACHGARSPVMTRPEASSCCSCDWSIVDKRTGATDVSYQVMMAVSVQVGRLGSGHLSQVRMFCYMGAASFAPPCPHAVCPACCRWDWPGEGGSCLPSPRPQNIVWGRDAGRAGQSPRQTRLNLETRENRPQSLQNPTTMPQCHNAHNPHPVLVCVLPTLMHEAAASDMLPPSFPLPQSAVAPQARPPATPSVFDCFVPVARILRLPTLPISHYSNFVRPQLDGSSLPDPRHLGRRC